MARKIIEDKTFELIGILENMENIKFVNDGDIPYIIVENTNPLIPEDKFYRIQLTTNGGITRERSTNGTNWEWQQNHADSMSFGSVMLSDSYTANGGASQGLAPSQHALSDGLKGKDISSTVTTTSDVLQAQVYRIGNLVNVYCRLKTTASTSQAQITGLPTPVLPVHNFRIMGLEDNTGATPTVCVAALSTDGEFALTWKNNTTAPKVFQFSYITSAALS